METNATSGNRILSYFGRNPILRKIFFIGAFLCCLSPFISPPIAFLIGIFIAQFVGHPYLRLNHRITQLLLQFSVVGLGFGINASEALKAGKEGVIFTVVSILGTLTLGYLLGKLLTINNKTSFLISAGTAICGGSAIAAVSPIIKAEEKQISIALGTVFILNSVALFIFPLIGSRLHLSQSQFGLWCAIAIHDTSSVVGAASKYGNEALQIATTVKLTRALWIIPVSLLSGVIFKTKNGNIKLPYFIGLFALAIIVNTYMPIIGELSGYIVHISKSGLTATLFLIGGALSKEAVAAVGLKPMLQGILLWIVISLSALFMIIYI